MDTPNIIVKAYPTTKEQLVSSAIGLGATVVVIGGIYAVGAIAYKVSERRAKKLAESTETNTN